MGFYSRHGVFLVLLSGLLCVLSATAVVHAQGFLPTQETLPSIAGAPLPGGLDLKPANPLGLPGGVLRPVSGTIPLSSGMLPGLLPVIPNLELGFNYSFGPRLRTGRFYADYLLPVTAGGGGILFAEAHAEGLGFWKGTDGAAQEDGPATTVYTDSAAPNRFDISLGGGYRRIIGGTSIFGANAFYDTTRLWKAWYPAWGWGLELFSKLPGESALDLQFNHYGNQFNRNALVNVFRNGGVSWDFEAGYSVPVLNQAFDLRMKLRGYQFDNVTKVYGWNAGAELTTRNGAFTIRYEHGQDRVNGCYDTIGGFANVGFQLDSLFRAENPFSMPEPVFGSPRNTLRTLTQKVRRDWHQPIPAVLGRASPSTGGDPVPPGTDPPTQPPVRRLILVNVFMRQNGQTFTVDLPNNTYTVINPHPGSILYTRAYYSFRMSDNSLQSVRITNYVDSASWVHLGWGETAPYDRATVGPQMMDAPIANTRNMFGLTLGWHHVCFNVPGTGHIVFDVPSDPSIVPLVVRINVR